jgi:CheY-like chemotaxis protein
MAKNGLILLIDDDRDEQENLQDAWQKLGIENELICFSNGTTALAYLQSTDVIPLFILSDINMPGMNGTELHRLITEDRAASEKSIPFIFLTTATGTLAIKQAYESKCARFLSKAGRV